MLWSGGIRCQVRQVDLGLQHGRELNLGLLGRFPQTLQTWPVLAQVDPVFLLEFLDEIIHHALVEVIAAQVGIPIRGAHLKNAFAHIQDRNIECAAAQVVDRNDFVSFLVQSIRQRGSGRFVYDAQHFQTGNLSGILGGIALGIVEIGRHSDDCLCHCFAEIGFGIPLDLGQDHGRDFRR